MRHAILAALLGAALLAGCGGDDSADAAATAATHGRGRRPAKSTDTIKIVDFVYDPDAGHRQGGPEDLDPQRRRRAAHDHRRAARGKAFDSGTIKGKATGSLTIDKPGTYSYICEFHPFMKGEITVTK